MRTLTPAPDAAIDPATGRLRFGSYRGAIPAVDLASIAPNPLARIARHKRWLYVSACTDEVFVAFAVVRLGYSATAFVYVFDAREGRIVAHESRIGPTISSDVVNDRQGVRARFALGGASWRLEKDAAGALVAEVSAGDVRVRAALEPSSAPDPITAVAPVPDGVVDVTEKRALLAASGEVRVGSRTYALEGGLGGFDLTQGILARHTRWRWAFALGRAQDGERFGMNLVRGFAGEPECAVWIGDALVPVGEGVIEFDRAAPSAPWRVRSECGAVDLRFVPRDFHREDRRVLLVRARFVQAVGSYHGRVTVPGRAPLTLDGVLGVTEDQDTLW
jgi:hypothetical protein